MWWFWIAVLSFLLMVFLIARAMARREGGSQNVGLQQGHDVSLQGGAAGAGGLGDPGGGWGGGGWGDGGGGGE